MNAILQPLLKLQTLEFGPPLNSTAETEAAALRAAIPQNILTHYERFRARGKKGVALVSTHVCSGCHMSLTVSKVASLMRGADIERCDSCGRYLYWVPAPPLSAAEILSIAKPLKKARKRKTLAAAA